MKFLPYALPDIGDEEIAAVSECLRSGWITTGPRTKQFEKDFSSYLGGDCEAIAVNSATAGLHLALEAVGIHQGDEVIVPTMTFTATAEVVRYLGADPVILDIDPCTLNIDVAAIEHAITPRTKAIMPMHYGGLACDMEAIIAIARAHNLFVIEDAAHAFPSRYKGQLIGTLGSDVTVFSFYANKTITTAEGGMVVTRNSRIAKRVRVMRLHGIDRDSFDRYVSETPAWVYEVIAPGFKYNLSDVASAIGIEQLRKIDRFLSRRQELAVRYLDALRDLPLLLPPSPGEGGVHAWHLFAVRLKENAPVRRDQLIQQLADEGIGTGVHYIPLHRHPYWRDAYQLKPEQFPQAEAAYHSILSLPLYPKMTDEDLGRVVSALRKILCS